MKKRLALRTNRLISIFTTIILSFNGFPYMVLAEELNAPDYYSVQSGLDYEITTNITSGWINHESIDLVLTNTGSDTIHNWYLTFNTPYSIDNIWNGTIYETDGNGTYTITSNGWNQDIHTGESVTVGITFSSDTETELSIDPEWYLLNTQETVVDASQYTLEYTEYSAWESGFTGQLTLTPQVDCQHWSLTFTSNRQITAVSSAVLNTEDDDTYEITHDENNMRLYANNEYDFGIQGDNTEDPLDLSNVELTVVDLAYHLTDDEDNNGIPDYLEFMGMGGNPVEPTPTPTDAPTDTPTPEPTNTEIPTETPTDEPTETPTETVTPTEEPTPTIDPEADQDLDGIPDYIEIEIGTDPLKADTDDDYLSDYIEVMIGYDPTNPDTDNNGIIDGNEDYDNDGLINAQEIQIGTELTFEDTDWDHLTDGDEVNIYGTDPLVADTDNDGIEDGDEVEIGKNPLDCADGSIRVIQSISRDIDNVEDLAIDSVDVTATLANNIDRVLKIRDYYNVDIYSTDVYGRIGSPINFECEESFDTATVVFHYDDTQLGETDENDLGVLWYDESNGIYVVQEQAVIDTQNNTITLALSHFSTYVVVDLNMWNNPIVPDYSNYIMVVEEETSSYYWHDEERDLDSKEHECFVWWKLSHGSQYQIVQRLFGDMHCEDTSKILQLWYINFTWLVMDMTDSDEDGILDYMETQGVLGTNNHIYYSDPTVEDGDGDTLTDNEEFGVRYTVFRTMDGALYIMLGLTVVYESPDGVIDPDSQYYILHNYFDLIPCGYGRTISVIRSDAELIDSDGDESNDVVDAYPTRVNPLINYIFFGDDNLYEDVIFRSMLLYERLFDEYDMDCIVVHVDEVGIFNLLWSNLKNSVVEDGRLIFNDYEYYRGVDNLIIIGHGNEFGSTVLNPNLPIAEREEISASEYCEILDNCSTHINSVEFCSCYSALGGVQLNPAAAVVAFGDVDRTYGYDGLSRCGYPLYNACCYYESDCNGYYCFTKIGDPDSVENFSDCVSYVPVDPLRIESVVTSIYPWNVETAHYYEPIRSFESAGE